MRNLEIRFLKIDDTEIGVPVFAGVFLSASFVGSFSAPFSSLVFFILKMEKKAGGEIEKYKTTPLPAVPVCSGSFYVPF